MRVRLRQKVVVTVLRPLAWAFSRLVYGFTAEPFRKNIGPCLILSNHVSKLDPLFLSLSFRFPIYFVAAEGVFKKPFWSALLSWLMAPIPKLKGMSDLSTVKEMLATIREGGSVGLFPNGNTTFSGDEEHIAVGLSRLVRLMKVPLVLYNLNGLYGVDPRWARSLRSGRSVGKVVRVMGVEECSAMPKEELDRVIIDCLSVSSVGQRLPGALYRARRRAEYLERALFLCPDCRSVDRFRSDGSRVRCQECGYELEYGEDLSFRLIKGRRAMADMKDFYDFQAKAMRSLRLEELKAMLPLVSEGETWVEERRGKRDRILAEGLRVELGWEALRLSGRGCDETIPLENIEGFAIHLRNRVLFFPSGRFCYLKGDERRNALMYPYFFYTIKRLKGGTDDGFLGI